MPSIDWARQQWVHLTRKLLGVKSPARRGGMWRKRKQLNSSSSLAAPGVPEAPLANELKDLGELFVIVEEPHEEECP